MRLSASLTLVCLGCSFDASGVGMAPGVTASDGITTVPMESSSTTGIGATHSSGGDPSGSEATLGLSGSDSMTGNNSTATTTTTTTDPGLTTTTDPGTTTDPSTTTAMGSSGGCMEVPGYVDMDGDGNGDPAKPTMGCVGEPGFATNNIDCNDADAKAWTGHPENCDGVDNDCDGTIDEYDAGGNSDSCGGCDFKTRNGRLYFFCDAKKPWLDARVYCKYFSLDLMIDSDGGEHNWAAIELGFDIEARWIGGEDFSSPNYTWVDGSAVSGNTWAIGEPNNLDGGLDADCMALFVSGIERRWGDYVCTKSFKFICEGAVP